MHYLGIDVSKLKIDCCLYINGISSKKKNKIYLNNPTGFFKLIDWLNNQDITLKDIQVTLEATGAYHENLCEFLYKHGLIVCVSNPARTRRFAQAMSIIHKTDKVDSEVLARYGAIAKPQQWQPDSESLKLLKQLSARREALLTDYVRETNRLEKAQSTTTSIIIIEMIKSSINIFQSAIERIDQLIDQQIKDDDSLLHDVQLLESIPAVGKRTSLIMLLLFRSRTFETASQAAAFVGLVPVHKQSGTSVRGQTRISKAGSSRIRACLYMASIVAIRFNPDLKIVYQRLLSNGKAKMVALCAVMRKLVHLCFSILKHQQPYSVNFSAITV